MFFHLAVMLIIGLLTGAVARLIWPGRGAVSLITTATLAVAGSLVGGLIGRMLFGASEGRGLLRPSFLLSAAGAALLLWVWSRIDPARNAAAR